MSAKLRLEKELEKSAQEFEIIKKEVNSDFSDRDPVQQELNMIRNDRLLKEQRLQKMIANKQAPNINRGL